MFYYTNLFICIIIPFQQKNNMFFYLIACQKTVYFD